MPTPAEFEGIKAEIESYGLPAEPLRYTKRQIRRLHGTKSRLPRPSRRVCFLIGGVGLLVLAATRAAAAAEPSVLAAGGLPTEVGILAGLAAAVAATRTAAPRRRRSPAGRAQPREAPPPNGVIDLDRLVEWSKANSYLMPMATPSAMAGSVPGPKKNEDSAVAFALGNRWLVVGVADGVSSTKDGGIAASLALNAGVRAVLESVSRTPAMSASGLVNAAFHAATNAVRSAKLSDEAATTMTLAVFDRHRSTLAVGGVGDSPAVYVGTREGRILRPHACARSGALVRHLGANGGLGAWDVYNVRLRRDSGAWIVLATDGLAELVGSYRPMIETLCGSEDPGAHLSQIMLAADLIAADNASVAILQIDPEVRL